MLNLEHARGKKKLVLAISSHGIGIQRWHKAIAVHVTCAVHNVFPCIRFAQEKERATLEACARGRRRAVRAARQRGKPPASGRDPAAPGGPWRVDSLGSDPPAVDDAPARGTAP